MAENILSLNISSVSLDPENARKHTDFDIDKTAKSLKQFGQVTPIVVDADSIVVKGNGTLLAAIKLGWTKIKAVRTTLTGAQLRAYAIADNQTALNSEWDIERLEEQVKALDAQLQESLGFSDEELAKLLEAEDYDPVHVDEHERTPPDAQDDFSVRVDKVSPDDKDSVVELINRTLETAGYAYRSAAF